MSSEGAKLPLMRLQSRTTLWGSAAWRVFRGLVVGVPQAPRIQLWRETSFRCRAVKPSGARQGDFPSGSFKIARPVPRATAREFRTSVGDRSKDDDDAVNNDHRWTMGGDQDSGVDVQQADSTYEYSVLCACFGYYSSLRAIKFLYDANKCKGRQV
ncbi:uncharacterized protein P884DRAFT_267771 [Thermothelomyces heterothallicus CBS 202.75]|uniref:uncharacterized protein n=1 Tax=Thermothelomyces heterothallicus CBS 202.75 TaxID=1149848 RepID=UPI0037445ED7